MGGLDWINAHHKKERPLQDALTRNRILDDSLEPVSRVNFAGGEGSDLIKVTAQHQDTDLLHGRSVLRDTVETITKATNDGTYSQTVPDFCVP